MSWLPSGKRAAVTLSVDDVHPAAGALHALDHVRWLQSRHPALRVTLFVTPDWRSLAPFASPSWRQRTPWLRSVLYHVPVLPAGTLRLQRHPEFSAYLRAWPGAELAIHGLHHAKRGPRPLLEFEGRSAAKCARMLRRALTLFEDASLPVARGVCPPGWEAPPELIAAMSALDFAFLASARDLDTPITAGAVTAGSGLRGMSLIRPQRLPATNLCHVATNFQATSSNERALEIVRHGGLLHIKAHLLESMGTYRALDGLNERYRGRLDELLMMLEDRFGDDLWWPTVGEAAARA